MSYCPSAKSQKLRVHIINKSWDKGHTSGNLSKPKPKPQEQSLMEVFADPRGWAWISSEASEPYLPFHALCGGPSCPNRHLFPLCNQLKVPEKALGRAASCLVGTSWDVLSLPRECLVGWPGENQPGLKWRWTPTVVLQLFIFELWYKVGLCVW